MQRKYRTFKYTSSVAVEMTLHDRGYAGEDWASGPTLRRRFELQVSGRSIVTIESFDAIFLVDNYKRNRVE